MNCPARPLYRRRGRLLHIDFVCGRLAYFPSGILHPAGHRPQLISPVTVCLLARHSLLHALPNSSCSSHLHILSANTGQINRTFPLLQDLCLTAAQNAQLSPLNSACPAWALQEQPSGLTSLYSHSAATHSPPSALPFPKAHNIALHWHTAAAHFLPLQERPLA